MITNNKTFLKLTLICLSVLFLSAGYSVPEWQNFGNDLNESKTNSDNFWKRFDYVAEVIDDLIAESSDVGRTRDYLERSKYSLKEVSLHSLKIDGNEEEYYCFFDLIFYNIIEFKHGIFRGKPLDSIVPRIMPRLADAYNKSLKGITQSNNFKMRRSFIKDFWRSPYSRKIPASDKIRLKAYINNAFKINSKQKLRRIFDHTDKVLKLLRRYLVFNSDDINSDLFPFNKELHAIVEEDEKINEQVPVLKKKQPQQKNTENKQEFSISSLSDKNIIIIGAIIVSILILIEVLILVWMHKKQKIRARAKKVATKTPFEDLDDMSVDESRGLNLDAVSKIMVSTLPERYTKIRKLSQGGMGVVFVCEDSFLKRRVAIKMISPVLSTDKVILKRFVQEARAVAALDHPNIVNIFDVGGERYPYFVMEFLEGLSIEEILRRKNNLSVKEVKFYGIQMAEAFSYCHKHNTIHRDIKPANILVVDNFRRIKIVDFGIAKDPGTTDVTRTSVSIGSPLYMAPEQLNNNTYGPSSDIYSFGMTMYKMVAGHLPFDIKDISARLVNDPEPLKKYNKDIPTELSELIMLCIQRDTSKRHKNFELIREGLMKIKV